MPSAAGTGAGRRRGSERDRLPPLITSSPEKEQSGQGRDEAQALRLPDLHQKPILPSQVETARSDYPAPAPTTATSTVGNVDDDMRRQAASTPAGMRTAPTPYLEGGATGNPAGAGVGVGMFSSAAARPPQASAGRGYGFGSAATGVGGATSALPSYLDDTPRTSGTLSPQSSESAPQQAAPATVAAPGEATTGRSSSSESSDAQLSSATTIATHMLRQDSAEKLLAAVPLAIPTSPRSSLSTETGSSREQGAGAPSTAAAAAAATAGGAHPAVHSANSADSLELGGPGDRT